jgi:hypothetical protein
MRRIKTPGEPTVHSFKNVVELSSCLAVTGGLVVRRTFGQSGTGMKKTNYAGIGLYQNKATQSGTYGPVPD